MTMTSEDADRAAEEQRRLYSEREIAEPYWNGWRVISWLAYRDPLMICAIEGRDALLLGMYDHPSFVSLQKFPICLDNSPANTLRLALQTGGIAAIDAGGRTMTADDFAFISNVWSADRYNWNSVRFKRTEVLAAFPPADGQAPQGTGPMPQAPAPSAGNATAGQGGHLDGVVRGMLTTMGVPGSGGKVMWDGFCDAVRTACEKTAKHRGYGDRSIRRAVARAQEGDK